MRTLISTIFIFKYPYFSAKALMIGLKEMPTDLVMTGEKMRMSAVSTLEDIAKISSRMLTMILTLENMVTE